QGGLDCLRTQSQRKRGRPVFPLTLPSPPQSRGRGKERFSPRYIEVKRALIADRSLLIAHMPYIGIDFGTSNSVVADFQFGRPIVLPNHEGQHATPSVVTIRRDGSLAFGQEAKENYDEQRSIRSIKRVLGSAERIPLVGQDLRPEQVAVMLFSLLKRDAEAVLRQPFSKAVVTIP